ncbi:MAG: nucleoside hydrolase [Alphaproteobacteria bacterium]
MQRKLILDTDCGADDALAIAYALAHPDLDLAGVTTVFGNTGVEKCTLNAMRLLQHWGSKSEVAEGAAAPRGDAPNRWFYPADMKDGLGDAVFPPLDRQASTLPAADFLVEIVKQHPGDIDICAIGPLTNIAAALDRDPSFAGNVRSLIVMGGAVFRPGNTTAFAEANISNDPAAAQAVFSAIDRVVLAPLDVTEQTDLDERFFTRLAAANPGCGDVLATVTGSFRRMGRRLWDDGGFVPHDLLTLAFLTDPGLFQSVQGRLSVTLDGAEIGRTLFDNAGTGPHRVLTGIDAGAFAALAFRVLAALDSGGATA